MSKIKKNITFIHRFAIRNYKTFNYLLILYDTEYTSHQIVGIASIYKLRIVTTICNEKKLYIYLN